MKTIRDKAMIVNLDISEWHNQRVDRKAGAAVQMRFDPERVAGKYVKTLLPEDNLVNIQAVIRKARRYHAEVTLPWDREGSGLLPVILHDEYFRTMRELVNEFDEAVANFLAIYPELVERETAVLKGLYNPDDYPSADKLRTKFGIRVQVFPIPEGGDLRVGLPEEDMANLIENVEKSVEDRISTAMSELWGRIYEVTVHLLKKVKGDVAVRSSAIEHVKEICNLAKKLNLVEDPNLDEIRKDLEKRVATLQIEDLNPDEAKPARNKVAAELDEIVGKMGAYMGAGTK